jgi:hypothetical protein
MADGNPGQSVFNGHGDLQNKKTPFWGIGSTTSKSGEIW